MILKIFYNPWKVVGFHEILLSLKIIHSEKKDIQVQYKDHQFKLTINMYIDFGEKTIHTTKWQHFIGEVFTKIYFMVKTVLGKFSCHACLSIVFLKIDELNQPLQSFLKIVIIYFDLINNLTLGMLCSGFHGCLLSLPYLLNKCSCIYNCSPRKNNRLHLQVISPSYWKNW